MTIPATFDQLSTADYCGVVTADDLGVWETQQQAFARLRDLSTGWADSLDELTRRLRERWIGDGAERFAAEAGRVAQGFRRLGANAGSNSDGMREMTAVLRDLWDAARKLRDEDDDWKANPDNDDAATVSAARQSVRIELREKLKDSGENLQRYAWSFLVPPGEPGYPSGTEAPRFQTAAASVSAPNPALNPVQPPVTPPPLEAIVPGVGSAAPIEGPSAAGARTTGPVFGEVTQREPSRMRSPESRQDVANRLAGRKRPRDGGADRRVRASEGEPAFGPAVTTVVPPVIGAPVPYGPHESGPVLTEPVARRYPEYWDQLVAERAAPDNTGPDHTGPDNTRADNTGPDNGLDHTGPDTGLDHTAPRPDPAPVTPAAAAPPSSVRIVRGGEYFRIVAGLPREQAREFIAAQARLRREQPDR